MLASHMVMLTDTMVQIETFNSSAMGSYRFLLPISNLNKFYVISSYNKVKLYIVKQ